MCCFIDRYRHKRRFYFSQLRKCYEPIKLEEDMLVYKVLYHDIYNDLYYTPYVHLPINFKDDKCILKPFSKFRFLLHKHMKGKNGYHSFFSKSAAIGCCITFETDIFANIKDDENKEYVIMKGIIPKGSYVYYGDQGDIVSSELVISKVKVKRYDEPLIHNLYPML